MQIVKNRPLVVGLVLLVLLMMTAVFAEFIAPYPPNMLHEAMLQPPSSDHLFGTDGLGRDVFCMVIYGTRISLKVGLFAALLSTVIGTFIGGVSGFYGGWIDRVLSEVINVFLMIPSFFLILIVLMIYGSNIFNVILVIGLTGWTRTAKLMRAQALSLKGRTFIKAGRTIGESDSSILFRHIIPHGIVPIVADMSLSVSAAILFEAGLAFIGLGDPDNISWGQIMNFGKSYLETGWWICTFSGLFIMFTVLAFHMISEGINNILNGRV